METAETVHAKRCACPLAYAEGTVIKLGEGRYGVYIDADFRDNMVQFLGKRIRILILGPAGQGGRRRERRGTGGTP
jgi:hypothetical protein